MLLRWRRLADYNGCDTLNASHGMVVYKVQEFSGWWSQRYRQRKNDLENECCGERHGGAQFGRVDAQDRTV